MSFQNQCESCRFWKIGLFFTVCRFLLLSAVLVSSPYFLILLSEVFAWICQRFRHVAKILQKNATQRFTRHSFHTKNIKEFHRQTFERLDLNRDGFINELDLKWTLSTMGYGDGIIALMGYRNKDHLVSSMMLALDKDKTGIVNLESLVKFIEEKCPPEDNAIESFKELDNNGDGFVSKAELRQFLKQRHHDIPLIVLDDLVDKQMSLYDKDKDGYVTMNEYVSAWYYLDVVGALILRLRETKQVESQM